MRQQAEVADKRCLLQRDRGWGEALDWYRSYGPTRQEVRKVLLEASRWNPEGLGARLYKYGRVEALEWILDEGITFAPTTRGVFPPPPRRSRTQSRPPWLLPPWSRGLRRLWAGIGRWMASARPPREGDPPMKRVAEVENKKDLLEKSRGWLETLDWFITSRPSESEVQEALARLAEWNPTELRGKLYRQGQWEALEWLLGR